MSVLKSVSKNNVNCPLLSVSVNMYELLSAECFGLNNKSLTDTHTRAHARTPSLCVRVYVCVSLSLSQPMEFID